MRWKHSGMHADDEMPLDLDPEAKALIRRTGRVVGVVLALVLTLMSVVALISMRYVAHDWSKQDVMECESSAFVSQAARIGASAREAAMNECLAHRHAKRWGPWGAFGSADDHSKYNGADD
jgi:hypothetical protein